MSIILSILNTMTRVCVALAFSLMGCAAAQKPADGSSTRTGGITLKSAPPEVRTLRCPNSQEVIRYLMLERKDKKETDDFNAQMQRKYGGFLLKINMDGTYVCYEVPKR